jgi:hypothetical protein
MDDQKENEDLKIGQDGSIEQGIKVDVKTDESNTSEPEINNIQPPAEGVISDTFSEDGVQIEDDNSAASAVNFIAGGDSANETQTTEITVSDDNTSTDENNNGVVMEPAVVEAPESETSEDYSVATDENSLNTESNAQTKEEETAISGFSSTVETLPSQTLTETKVSGMSNNEQAQPHEHRNNKKLAIIITVIVAFLLAGASVYVYLAAQGNTEEATSSATEQSTQQDAKPATVQDVDSTIREIDQTLESIQDADLSEETVSDDTLGL